MNWQQVEGQWEQFKGGAKRKWGQLTNNDVDKAQGDYEKMVGKLKSMYGLTREKAEAEMAEIEQRLNKKLR